MQYLAMAEIVVTNTIAFYSHLSQRRLLWNRNLHGVSTLAMM